MTSLDVAGVQPDEAIERCAICGPDRESLNFPITAPRNSDEDQIKESLISGLKYNLLTQYTSFIAVREEVSNTHGAGEGC